MRTAIMIAALVRAAAADPFEPPSANASAQEHYTRAKTLFAAKQYADAAAEFQAAYDLDSSAKFLLFDLGLARRLAGACREAISAYRAFLDAQPPEKHATSAKVGLEKCEDVLAHAPPLPDQPVTPPPPPPPAPKPVAPPPAPPAALVHVMTRGTWYSDRLGDVFAGAGVVTLALGGTLYLAARGAAADTFTAPSLGVYRQRRADAMNDQGGAFLCTMIGTALLTAGVVRFIIRPEHEIVVAPMPTRGGAAVSVEGSF